MYLYTLNTSYIKKRTGHSTLKTSFLAYICPLTSVIFNKSFQDDGHFDVHTIKMISPCMVHHALTNFYYNEILQTYESKRKLED